MASRAVHSGALPVCRKGRERKSRVRTKREPREGEILSGDGRGRRRPDPGWGGRIWGRRPSLAAGARRRGGAPRREGIGRWWLVGGGETGRIGEERRGRSERREIGAERRKGRLQRERGGGEGEKELARWGREGRMPGHGSTAPLLTANHRSVSGFIRIMFFLSFYPQWRVLWKNNHRTCIKFVKKLFISTIYFLFWSVLI